MPLALAEKGKTEVIRKVGGNPEVRNHLEKLGFVPGNQVVVLNETQGNLIVNILESRIAIGKDMAMKIMIG